MSLTLYRLNVVPDPDSRLQDLLGELIDNSVLAEADLVEILTTIGAEIRYRPNGDKLLVWKIADGKQPDVMLPEEVDERWEDR